MSEINLKDIQKGDVLVTTEHDMWLVDPSPRDPERYLFSVASEEGSGVRAHPRNLAHPVDELLRPVPGNDFDRYTVAGQLPEAMPA
jgi:hypothetical protein